MKKIAIFASGSGTNAQNIIEHFMYHKNVRIEIVLSNNKNAGVHKRAEHYNIPTLVFSKSQLYDNNFVGNLLEHKKIDLIVLSGFLWLIPESIIDKFPNRIINIHPALLPKYGGKGMYGAKVHEAVLKNNEQESGITIHYVNKQYDKGSIIFQKSCDIELYQTPELLAEKIHSLEYKYFPEIIENIINEL